MYSTRTDFRAPSLNRMRHLVAVFWTSHACARDNESSLLDKIPQCSSRIEGGSLSGKHARYLRQRAVRHLSTALLKTCVGESNKTHSPIRTPKGSVMTVWRYRIMLADAGKRTKFYESQASMAWLLCLHGIACGQEDPVEDCEIMHCIICDSCHI